MVYISSINFFYPPDIPPAAEMFRSKPNKIRPSYLASIVNTLLKQQNVQARTTKTAAKDGSPSVESWTWMNLDNEVLAPLLFKALNSYRPDKMHLPAYKVGPRTPAIHYHKFSTSQHLYLVYMPGLALTDVKLKLEKGKVFIQGDRMGKNWIEDCLFHYAGSIDLPENLPEEHVFSVRMSRGVMKIQIQVEDNNKVEKKDLLKKNKVEKDEQEFDFGDFRGKVF